jgi:triacylglycerol esterase/lipase EstA (alpha/beta hydrolase family)
MLRAALRIGLLVLLLLAAACSRLGVRSTNAGDFRLRIDGLELADGPTDSAREVISMLALERACRQPDDGCAERILATPGTVRAAARTIAAADIDYLAALHGRGQQRAQAWLHCAQLGHRYLHAPELPGRRSALDSHSQLALRLYNACTAGLLASAQQRTPQHPLRLRWDVDESRFPRAAVQRLELAAAVHVHGLRTRQYDDGLGVAAVAIGRTRQPLGSFPAQPFALAVTVRFEPGADGDGLLVVTDASRGQRVDTAFGPLVLARNVSAAYGLAAVQFEKELSAWQSLRGRTPGGDEPQIRLLAPVDPVKTPVILIHGLASSPLAWANVANELLGDPDIARHYQIWLVRYPTGLPLLVNRERLASRLRAFRALAAQPGHPTAVLVGHSMGGVLARLLLTDPGEHLWRAAFTEPADALKAPRELVDAARKLLVFKPLEDVDEVVFIAAPHGGSTLADSTLGRLTRHLIHMPAQTLGFMARLTRLSPASVQPSMRASLLQGGPDSVETLSPNQPVIRAARNLPVIAGVRIHSIIGIADPADPAQGDGVVSLQSAQWPVGSEDRVIGGHNLEREPATITILKRILLDRLQRERTGATGTPAG